MKDNQTLPKVSRAEVEKMCGESFAERAASLLSLLSPELSAALPDLTVDAYEPFDGDPAPLVKVDENAFFLELWHGTTGTYADISQAVMSRLRRERKGEMPAGDGRDVLRIAPLTACYFSAYADLIDAGEIDYGDEVNFCVPYGAEYLLAAGQYASEMGLPIGKLIYALKNDETADFSGKDVSSEKLTRFRVDEEDISDTIACMFDEYGYLLDPHSAAAATALEEYAFGAYDASVTVVFAVASPHLFASEVLPAVGKKSTGNVLRDIKILEEVTACEPPEALIKLSDKAKLFTGTIDAEKLVDMFRSFLGKTENKG